jgi:hypothetical protein
VNRNVWVSVIGTVAVLGVLDYAAGGASRAAGAAKAGAALVARALPAFERAADLLGAVVSWDLVGLLVVAVLVLSLGLMRRRPARGHREPWTRVVALGRQGRSVSSIAQVTRQSHDVVRILLAPVAVERVPVRGKSFRPRASEEADAPPAGRFGPRP